MVQIYRFGRAVYRESSETTEIPYLEANLASRLYLSFSILGSSWMLRALGLGRSAKLFLGPILGDFARKASPHSSRRLAVHRSPAR